MQKISSIIAIVMGSFLTLTGLLLVLNIREIGDAGLGTLMTNKFWPIVDILLGLTVIGIGVLSIMKPRSIATIVLLGLFVFSFLWVATHGWQSTAGIISLLLSIAGIATTIISLVHSRR